MGLWVFHATPGQGPPTPNAGGIGEPMVTTTSPGRTSATTADVDLSWVMVPSRCQAPSRDSVRALDTGGRVTLVVLTLALSTSCTALADDETDEEVEVWARWVRPGSISLPAPLPEVAPTLAEALIEVDGVSAMRRGGGGPEPVVRGMGGERVQTRVGGLSLYGACPSRMDPPATTLAPAAASSARLVAGLPSVTDGPLTTGAAVELSLDPLRRQPGTEGQAWVGWDGVRRGIGAGLVMAGSDDRLDYRASAGLTRQGDYRSASGLLVPAHHEATLGSLALSARLAPRHRLWLATSLLDERDTAFAALPMDLRTSRVVLVQGGSEHDLGGAVLRARAGYATVDHAMDNEDKPSFASVRASTDSGAESWSVGALVEVPLGASWVLVPGLDATGLNREAVRERLVVATGMGFEDALWPDVSQLDLGAFTEARLVRERLSMVVGARLDAVHSQAGRADAPSLEGLTVADQWVAWYGDAAAEPERVEWTGGGSAVARYRLTEGTAIHLGLGAARRAAGVTERYFAFALAPGGYRVGNPGLVAETRTGVEVGATWGMAWGEGRATLFGARVGDYIQPIALAARDIDGDGVGDAIEGYTNVDAVLAGADGSATLSPLPWLSLPLGLQWVVARDLSSGEPLAEIPPLEGHLAGRATLERPVLGGHIEMGARLVAPQRAVSANASENETPGFALVRAELAARLHQQLEIGVAVENLLDADYHEHLTREAALPVGDLLAGDEIPGPGRALRIWLRWDLAGAQPWSTSSTTSG